MLWWAFLCENHMGYLKEHEHGVRWNRVNTQLCHLPLMSWKSSQKFHPGGKGRALPIAGQWGSGAVRQRQVTHRDRCKRRRELLTINLQTSKALQLCLFESGAEQKLFTQRKAHKGDGSSLVRYSGPKAWTGQYINKIRWQNSPLKIYDDTSSLRSNPHTCSSKLHTLGLKPWGHFSAPDQLSLNSLFLSTKDTSCLLHILEPPTYYES